jgi:hypothetical protein
VAAIRSAASPRASSVAVTSRSIARSTSVARSTGSRPKLRQLNMTRIAPRASPCSTTRTARSATSWPERPGSRFDDHVRPRGRHPGRQLAPLSKIPLGTTIHNIELKEGKGGQMALRLVPSPVDGARRRLGDAPSPLQRNAQVHIRCYATIGQVGNPSTRTSRSARPAGRVIAARSLTTAVCR